MIEYKDIILAKEVSSGLIEYDSYYPVNGEEIELTHFSGHACYSMNSCVSIRWGTLESNEILYSTKGDIDEDIYYYLIGDGYKKLFLFLENGESGNVILSGRINFISRS